MPDPAAPLFDHFRDPAISVFQSAVAATDARHRAGSDPSLPPGTPAPPDRGAPMVQATARAARAIVDAPAAASAAALQADGVSRNLDTCASAYLALALAQARGDEEAIAAARAALPPFGRCDSRWSETLTEFLLHYGLSKHGDVPYRRWTSLDDFVLPDPADAAAPVVLPDKARIAIFGDWGTGEPRAQALLRAVADLRPDIVIHLGDIYYSCDLREADTFFTDIRSVFPEGSARVFTLCGNHDMYGGGGPYYALLDRLGQPASFFCLRNDHWQLLAMDTGYNDFNPLEVNETLTWVQDGTNDEGRPDDDGYSELDWHLDKLNNPGGRRTVLLSHHPLFTRSSPIGGDQVVNGRLHAQLRPWLADLALWAWGHEHNQILYAPFAGLQRGRCLGAGAIPTLANETPYDTSLDFATGLTPPRLAQDPEARLPVDGATGLYDLGFGLLTLDGKAGSMTYYRFNETDGARVAATEALT